MLPLSVILCSHNPRPEYLARALGALEQQTLARAQWELWLVDNASATPLQGACDLTWHPAGRHVREDTLGLTAARLRGIAEARGDVLVFVDDDNVLARDYLEQALAVARQWPQVGAWGGMIQPEFETPPPDWAKPHLGNLTLYDAPQDEWSNLPDPKRVPPGAGLCVRAGVARRYADRVRSDPRRLALDRCGARLTNCGDTDLALTAVDLGLGTGRFTALRLTHLIPARRLTLEYFADFLEQTTYSFQLLQALRPGIAPPEAILPQGPVRRRAYNLLRRLQMNLLPREQRILHQAALRGTLRGNAEVARARATPPPPPS